MYDNISKLGQIANQQRKLLEKQEIKSKLEVKSVSDEPILATPICMVEFTRSFSQDTPSWSQ